MSAEIKIVANNNDIKKLPNNLEAEQIVLGGILNNNDYINKINDFISSQQFFEPIHQKLYEAIENLIDKGFIANPVTLKNVIQNDEALSELGGANYLLKLCSVASGVVNIKDYAKIIYNLYISRCIINISEETLEESYKVTGDESASKQIENPENKFFNLATIGYSETDFKDAASAITEAIRMADAASKRDGSISGLASKYTEIDKILGGFNKSDLLILAARPSMGKTALALNFGLNAAEIIHEEYQKQLEEYKNSKNQDEAPKEGCVGIISLEMSAEQLATRLLSIKTGINASNIRRGKLSKTPQNDEFAKLMHASAELNQLKIFIDDTPALSISAIRTRARRMKRKNNLQFLIIDYLQLIRGVNKKSQESRVQEISEISMGLKAIAKELNIPVLALSQLSRQVEQRQDKRPQLSDLRESGSIEQDADIVMFIYREAYYKERDKPQEGTEAHTKWQEQMNNIDHLSEIMISKNRNGPINNITLFFDKNTTKFGNLQ